jgi:hypothetical protein
VALPPTHLTLTFRTSTPGPALPAAVVNAAVREAADIWSPYRVAIDQIGPCGSAPEEAVVLTVLTARSPAGEVAMPQGALGAVDFGQDGTPDPIVTVFVDQLMVFVEHVRVGHTSEDRWPSVLRERIVGRALGRVIAHELGHYLLGSRDHASTGLMRAVQRTDELFDGPRGGFTLSPSEVRRLKSQVVARIGLVE